jgi:hypothetical protein
VPNTVRKSYFVLLKYFIEIVEEHTYTFRLFKIAALALEKVVLALSKYSYNSFR